jgi:hypothetical protein
MDELIVLLQMRFGCRLPKASNKEINTVRLSINIDPIVVYCRPLVLYMFVKLAHVYVYWKYRVKYDLHYGRFQVNDLEYALSVSPIDRL